MKKVINISNDDLLFPRLDFSIRSKEIKNISDEAFLQVCGNSNIKEYMEPKIEVKEEIKVEKSKINKK